MTRVEKPLPLPRARKRKGKAVPRRPPSARQLVTRARAHNDISALVCADRIPAGLHLAVHRGPALRAAEVDSMLISMCDELRDMYEAGTPAGWDEQEKREELTHMHQCVLLASDDDGRAAFLSFRFDIEEGGPVLYVYELFVESRSRRKGLAVALMRAVEDIAQALAIPALMLTTFVANTAAMRLYRDKLGAATRGSTRNLLQLSSIRTSSYAPFLAQVLRDMHISQLGISVLLGRNLDNGFQAIVGRMDHAQAHLYYEHYPLLKDQLKMKVCRSTSVQLNNRMRIGKTRVSHIAVDPMAYNRITSLCVAKHKNIEDSPDQQSTVTRCYSDKSHNADGTGAGDRGTRLVPDACGQPTAVCEIRRGRDWRGCRHCRWGALTRRHAAMRGESERIEASDTSYIATGGGADA
eukprot:IDg12471t1